MITIRQVDLSDTAHFLGSADLVSFAQSIGRYDPSEGPFDVAWAYGDRAELQSYYNTNRLWGAFNLVAPSLGLTPEMPFASRPVYVVPDEPLTRQDFAEICRYHYEGTSLDETDWYELMSPHKQTNRPICHKTTDYSAVWQLRGWLPDAVGGVMWVAPSRPCSSAYVPFYDSVASVPSEWTDATAYNAFRAVADSLDQNGKVNGVRRYKYYSPLVRSTYGAFEASCTGAQACVESIASCLSGSARVQYLTEYSSYRATQALDLALSLPAQMP
jgi:dipeptidase